MRRLVWSLCAWVILGACGAAPDPVPQDAAARPPADAATVRKDAALKGCARRAGKYMRALVLRSGSCPQPAEGIVSDTVLNGAPWNPQDCAGGTSVRDDGCTLDMDFTCTIAGEGNLRVQGVSRWDVAGKLGKGIETWAITSKTPGVSCMSSYDVTIRQL